LHFSLQKRREVGVGSAPEQINVLKKVVAEGYDPSRGSHEAS
jgi:hypothetical protein